MYRSSPKDDVFPKTPRTWFCRQIGLGQVGLAEANQHIMAVYAEPLKVYFRGSSFRRLGEADEIVNAYFADRLGRADFLAKWESSERPMRYWLLVGFRYFLMEQIAKRTADAGRTVPMVDEAGHSTSAAGEFHRQVARSVVREASLQAETECRRDGLSEHWDILMRHHLKGRPLVQIAADDGLDVVRVKVMARTAANRFRRTLREMLSWPGASRESVDEEIHELITTLAKEKP